MQRSRPRLRLNLAPASHNGALSIVFSDARGPDRVFDQVIVEATFAVIQMGAERHPLLSEMAAQLSAQAGRPVNFMIFESVEAAMSRAPSILIPHP